jgi:hypothetical protein
MRDAVKKNGAIVCAGAVFLTAAYAHEQFAVDPVDITSPQAQYTAGTVVAQPVGGYVAAPPHGRVQPGSVGREAGA